MVAIGYLFITLVSLTGFTTAFSTSGDMAGQINMESRFVKPNFGVPTGVKLKFRVRDESDVNLAKRISCAGGNCRIPSSFGSKHKVAAAVMRRDEDDTLYKRDEIESYLQSRGTVSRLAKTLKNHFLPFARAEDDLESRAVKGHAMGKKITFRPMITRDENDGRNAVSWSA